MDRGRKNRRNIRKLVVRNPTTLAQTILRRILLTGGSGVLSTTAPARGGAFAVAGSGGFAGAATRGGSPALTVSPGCGVVALLAGGS
jgi:hypothetical protein